MRAGGRSEGCRNREERIQIAIVLVTFLWFAGCGGGGSSASPSSPPPAVVVSLSPANATLFPGQTQQFTAVVSGSANQAVNWSVNGTAGGNAALGTISASGLYTAPQNLPASLAVTIGAASQADPSATGSATVSFASDLVVNLSPNSASVAVGGTQNFTASVTGSGSFNPAVTWSVNGVAGGDATVGTITSTGPDAAQFTAPGAPPAPATVTVSAKSVADPTRSASASVTIACGVNNAIAPADASISLGSSQIFSAMLCVPAGTSVAWDVNGIPGGNASLGTVIPTGSNTANYTAPGSMPPANPVTLRATSQSNPPQSASAQVTILSNVMVSVTPAALSLPVGQRASFLATVTGTADPAVNWSVNGVANGNAAVGAICVAGSNPCVAPAGPVSGSVDFLAPAAIPSPATLALVATSHADPSRSGSAQVTVVSAAEVAVSVAPAYAFLAPGASQQFTVGVSGTPDAAVTWTVTSAVAGQGCSGAACGTINSSGLYTAPASAPSPNAIAIVATSQADSSKSAAASAAVTSGPAIEALAPSSVIAAAANPFTLTITGQGFAAGNGSTGSVVLFGGSPRQTNCPNSEQCTITVEPGDVSVAGSLSVQIQNPGAPGALSNPVPFVMVPLDASEDVIALSAAQPEVTGRDIVVVESTVSPPVNVDFAGPLVGGTNCEAQGSPVFFTRPPSGTATTSLCIHGNGLDPSFRYEFSGPLPNDITVTATSLESLLTGLVRLDVTISSNTIPGLRTLFITTANNDRAAASGMLEVK